ncbi:conjugal transfer protein TraN [Yoonia sp. SS1-5]|uniref:Conjugal transfer protein TraN n=1 Tax=Yoonia rhodophyticola TaxID=3137370 RepID=A0AAN0MD65_9RHOB
MKRLFLLCSLALAGAAQADSHVQRAENALSNAQTFNGYTVPDAQNLLQIPVDPNHPLSNENAQTLPTVGNVAAASTSTTEGRAFQNFNTNAVPWSVQSANPQHLDVSDQVANDPMAFMNSNPFSSSGFGQCTVTNFANSPIFERTCQRTRDVFSASCTSQLNITVIRTETYECHVTPTGASCDALQASSLCTETQRYCNLQDINGVCIEEIAEHSCSSDAPLAFTAPQIGATTWGQPITSWVTSCDPSFSAQSCGAGTTTCTSGPSVEDVNGQLVPVNCTTQVTTYECGASTYSSTDCQPFQNDPSCSLQASSCYLTTPDGVCGAYEDTYQCGTGQGTDFSSSCQDVNVCVAGHCQSIPQETNSDMPMALASVDLLNNMANEWTMAATPNSSNFELSYFNSNTNYCRVGILGSYNCCSDNGWALGVFTQCRQHELELVAAQQAGRAVYVTTYCRRRALFFCRERARRYCIFNNRIAREVSFQAQHQLHGRFECRGLTQAEMEAIDWEQIDLTSVFGDMLANVAVPDQQTLIGIIQANTANLSLQP